MPNMELNNKKYYAGTLLFLMIFFVFSGRAQKPEGIPRYALVSAIIKDLSSRKVLAAYNPEKNMLSASLMKLVTTATALDLLGKDFKYSTKFWISGPVKNGILEGDLIIEGGGDPTLGSKYFPSSYPDSVLLYVKNILNANGINKINGKILVDESYLKGSRYPSRRLWEDMGNYYGAPPAALSWRDNTFTIVLRSPEKIGARCSVVSVSPSVENVSFDCQVIAAKHDKDSAYIYGLSGLERWEIRGSIPAGRNHFRIKGALPEPGLIFAAEVGKLLDDSDNIVIEKINNDDWRAKAQLIGQLYSPPLSDIVRAINHYSINLAADHLLISIGQTARQENAPDWDVGIQLIKNYWANKKQSYFLNIKDGSGLAPQSSVSPAFLVDMLADIYSDSSRFETFKNSLAISGVSGTLKYIWNQSALKGMVYGKSGSMKDVLGYAGYVFRDGQSPLAFAVMVNHHGKDNSEIKKYIERWLEKMVDM
ncbi:D-alanyl-D-alanine carboxypeptidase / D-alanyl-D-alanine-endopeptidase (penicillin-binding protein 4) [Thermophagus xiamenensis]|uniref:D-alanyl-D-alanine carboxypeptidase / D-alanyl-D-alanine-endopeptidase (Penicillin-binding protein 4) n=2 Tax=Thermophagus xiamenensis TaxID=385682 RepID=A0A1I2EC77_9BACT|nr:D-alanyl-D-alanine carboxypeptidase / D-alanyl-D-alanine-endopeptidase (penicillin-binding protein 4) [Thermophagus xiamenensis]